MSASHRSSPPLLGTVGTEVSIPTGFYADVLIHLETKAFQHQTFTYRVPSAFQGMVAVGIPVLVPFGQRGLVTGFIMGLKNHYEGDFTLRDIEDVLDEVPLFDGSQLDFFQWVSHYYATPLGQVLTAAIPSCMVPKNPKKVFLRLPVLTPNAKLSADEERILEFLGRKPGQGYRPSYLSAQLKIPLKRLSRCLASLKQKQSIFTENERKKVRKSHKVNSKRSSAPVQTSFGGPSPLTLSSEQFSIVETIRSSPPDQQTFLLHGVTGSGKTEVYMTLAQQMLCQGKTVLVLVPEIALTSQILKRFIECFGPSQIALWHSHLSDKERQETWSQILAGQVHILIGARSAIFLPFQNLGLIVVDEEHDSSYKQDTPAPRYHAQNLALELAKRHKAKLLCGSATPDIQSYWRAVQSHQRLVLTQRYGGRPLASVELISMKLERSHGNRGPLSRALIDTLRETISRQEQAIVLVNRRGFYTLMTCSVCDATVSCPQCSVGMTVHQPKHVVRCHYCGYETGIPLFCSQCTSTAFIQSGIGSQRIEEEVHQQIPEARVLRLDSDILGHDKQVSGRIFEQFAHHEADILVGTQMIAKGLDIANVTLVGVIHGDGAFKLPDYRSGERGFQLLTQVAGRSGRGDKPGQVLIQCHDPDHPILQFAKHQDYEGFYQYELELRQQWHFPPFSQLFRFIVSAEDEQKTAHFAQAAVQHLRISLENQGILSSIHLLGPAPCPVFKIQNRFRFHFLVKNQMGEKGHQAITAFFQKTVVPEEIHFLLDVESLTLL